MSVEDFLEEVIQGFKDDKDTIGAGPSKAVVSKWFDAFGEGYDSAANKFLGKA